jgi:hypothetical protein
MFRVEIRLADDGRENGFASAEDLDFKPSGPALATLVDDAKACFRAIHDDDAAYLQVRVFPPPDRLREAVDAAVHWDYGDDSGSPS